MKPRTEAGRLALSFYDTTRVRRDPAADHELNDTMLDHILHVEDEADALGAAWRRCEAAKPEGWKLTLATMGRGYVARVFVQRDGDQFGRPGPTAAAALTDLAEALEAM